MVPTWGDRFDTGRPNQMRVSSNGRASAFQADDAGSNPATRSVAMVITEACGPGMAEVRVRHPVATPIPS
jgi:hypothetical protein